MRPILLPLEKARDFVLASRDLLCIMLSVDCTQKVSCFVKLTIDATEVLRTRNPGG